MSTLRNAGVEQLQFMGNKLLMRAMKRAIGLMPIRDPELLVGASAMGRLADIISQHSLKKILIVTTAGIVKRDQTADLIRALELRGVTAVIYDGVSPDPTFEVVNEGLDLLKREECDGVVAFGGGSAMDAAKVIAVAAANNRAPEKLVGFFKGRKKPLPFFAVPTTAGTGSEATIVSVISDNVTHAKSFVIDSRTVPLAAALDPRLMASIPATMTAATGMDALTHAIEAYLSTISTPETDRNAIEAIQLIFEFLPMACKDGSNLEAREAMSIASYKAGKAFTKAFVGYVHAISHQLGAYYGIPHGLANAVVLPHVIEFSREAAAPKLAILAVKTGLGESSEGEAVLAQKFVDHISQLNAQLEIPQFAMELKEEDIPAIARGALKEALLNYPVPRHMTRLDCEQLLGGLLAA